MREIAITEEQASELDELLEMDEEVQIYRADGTVGTISRSELLSSVIEEES